MAGKTDRVIPEEEGADEIYNSASEDAEAPNELLSSLISYTKEILNKINEGKSVTRKNKEDITNAANKILEITQNLDLNLKKGNKQELKGNKKKDLIAEVRAVVREEVCKLSVPKELNSKMSYASAVRLDNYKIKQPSRPITKPALIVSPTMSVKNSEETLTN